VDPIVVAMIISIGSAEPAGLRASGMRDPEWTEHGPVTDIGVYQGQHDPRALYKAFEALA
jgi:hypothetical protein